MKVLIGLVMIILLVATACEGAQMTMEGPDSVAVDERAWYDVTITDLTPVGVVNYYPYLDLDDDGVMDDLEPIFGFVWTEFVNSDGTSDFLFFLDVDEFFEERELNVPDETVVSVYAEFYVSPDNVYPIGTVSQDLEIVSEE